MSRNVQARSATTRTGYANANQRFYGFRIPAGYVPAGQKSVTMCIGTRSIGTAEVRIPQRANALVVVEESEIRPETIGIYAQILNEHGVPEQGVEQQYVLRRFFPELQRILKARGFKPIEQRKERGPKALERYRDIVRSIEWDVEGVE